MSENQSSPGAKYETLKEAQIRVVIALKVGSDIHHNYHQTQPALLNLTSARVILASTVDGTTTLTELGSATYELTEKGHNWVRMLTNTPYPKHIWVDPRTNLATTK